MKRKRIDKNSPEAQKMIDEIVNGTFIREGTMIAFPLCFPGASEPIPYEDSFVTALDVGSDNNVYGGTSGSASHLFIGMFHGITGCVFDMGVVEGADQCVAVCCGRDKVVALVNGDSGGRVIMIEMQNMPIDLIQEWEFPRFTFRDLGEPVKGEKVVHAVMHPNGRHAIGSTTGHLFRVDLEQEQIEIIAEIAGSGKLGIDCNGNVLGKDEGNFIWRYTLEDEQLSRRAVNLPDGSWDEDSFLWSRSGKSNCLYIVDGRGELFALTKDGNFSDSLGRIPLTPVTSMAVTSDGRVFGSCGEGITQMFCYNPVAGTIGLLGCAASVIERRRYGYSFADAVVGRDGQVYFGENDSLGHLWIYFPSIQ